MSNEWKRLGKAISGRVQHEWERISALDRISIQDELKGPVQYPRTGSTDQTLETHQDEVIRDAAHARRILQVEEGATYEQVQASYQDLLRITDPNQFESGTGQFNRLTRLQQSLHRAHQILIDEFSITERRFRTLELN